MPRCFGSGTRNCCCTGTRSPGAATVPSSLITRPVALSRLAISGPHCKICFTCSRLMPRGFCLPAHFSPIHDRLRISRLRGWPLAAWLWCVQSGLMWNQPSARPWHSSSGSPSNTSVVKCRAAGWLAVCMLMAAGLWFLATVTGRPRPISRPVEVGRIRVLLEGLGQADVLEIDAYADACVDAVLRSRDVGARVVKSAVLSEQLSLVQVGDVP